MTENTTPETARLLVVSRESAILRPLWSVAEPNTWQIEVAVSAWDAMERVQSGVAPHLLLLDLPRGDGDNLHALRWMRRLRADLPIIVICLAEDAGRKGEALRLGAQEVLIRPFDEAKLESAIRRHLASPENGSGEVTSEDIEQVGPDSFFVSAGPASQKLKAQAELLAEADVPVLILGEVGSGKDTVAKLIHKFSVRSGFRFLKVNCADMPSELLEAELFGDERIHSPEAGRLAPGKLERAEKGTLFLDEIAEMPLALQDKLMQVLHDKALPKRNSGNPISADVRVVAGSSANIDRALADRKLREDLYYRLSAFTVQVPPLRQRRGEIAVLLRHSMHKVARHYGLPPREFPASVLEACQHYSWPGNLVELESFVKRYLVAGENDLTFSEVTSSLEEARIGHSPRTQHLIPGPTNGEAEEEQSSPKSLKSLIQTVKSEAERNAIRTALHRTGWNRKAAARLLRVSYRTLLYKIDQYHMSTSETFRSPLQEDKLSFQPTGAKGNGKAS